MEILKRFILNLGFVKKEIEDAKNYGFEADQLGIIKRFEMAKMREVDALADKKLNALLSPVDLTQIVTLEKTPQGGILSIGGEKADASKLANLRAEAEFITASEIWKLLQETPKELAHRAMFIQSESLDDLKKGKSILYTLSVQQNIVDVLKSFDKKS